MSPYHRAFFAIKSPHWSGTGRVNSKKNPPIPRNCIWGNISIYIYRKSFKTGPGALGPFLLTWINFNPNMDKS